MVGDMDFSAYGEGLYRYEPGRLCVNVTYMIFAANGEYFELQYLIPQTGHVPGTKDKMWKAIESFGTNLEPSGGTPV